MNQGQNIFPHILLAIYADVLKERREVVVIRAIGHQVEGKLELSLWHGERWLATFEEEPAVALAAAVSFVDLVRRTGVRARLNAKVTTGDLPF